MEPSIILDVCCWSLFLKADRSPSPIIGQAFLLWIQIIWMFILDISISQSWFCAEPSSIHDVCYWSLFLKADRSFPNSWSGFFVVNSNHLTCDLRIWIICPTIVVTLDWLSMHISQCCFLYTMKYWVGVLQIMVWGVQGCALYILELNCSYFYCLISAICFKHIFCWCLSLNLCWMIKISNTFIQ